ncbi:hypothetical protein ABPG77_011232 [Micractinium sp. CCAP 211/92]
MSLGYAEKLSYREDLGGQLGAPELFDSPEEVAAKVERLAQLVRRARRIVAFTGAGISTACGIPDFRGPAGIWTLQRAGQPLPRPKVSFTHAKPSLTHQVLLALMRTGKLDYLVSQNVDGLHLRSGIPRERIAELHGNCFAERCHSCGTEYIRDFEVETVGFKRTGRKCSRPGCGAALRDHILDWEDALPEDELELSEQHAKEADLAICLGTSLQITPACNLPLKATRTYKGCSKQEPGQLVIVNLQRTQHDNKATKSGGVVCHARCDEVMAALAAQLGLEIPPYERRDTVVVGHQQHASSGGGGSRGSSRASNGGDSSAAEEAATGSGSDSGRGGGPAIPFSVFVQSSHGPKCAMPMVQAVDFEFEDPSLKPASLAAPPFCVRRTAWRPGPLEVRVTLHLHETADVQRRTRRLSYTAELQAGLGARDSLRQQRYEFLTQRVEYSSGGVRGAPTAEGRQAAASGAAFKAEEAAAVAEAAAADVAAVPQAAAKPALALSCPPGGPKQQPKKQRVT